MKQIAIIGGGAAGLVAAISAARMAVACSDGLSVSVYEMDDRVGRRILATGNGRCNFSNLSISGADYCNGELVSRVFDRVPPQRVLDFFAGLGLVWSAETDGRLLPATGKATTVVDVLRAEMGRLGVVEERGAAVREIVPPAASEGRYTLCMADGRFCRADAVVIAVGGQDGLALLPDGVPATGFSPVLGPLKTDTTYLRALDNIRVKCAVTLLRGGAPVATEQGELLFRKYGVSGICIFNLSRFAQVGDVLSINLVPGVAAENLPAFVWARVADALALRPQATLGDLFRGLLLPAVADAVCAQLGFTSGKQLAKMTDADLQALSEVLGGFCLTVQGIGDEAQCQVHRGGIAVDAVDDAMQCEGFPGLFAAGEALDVDGPCGGYNLHWAWASGLLAGAGAARYCIVEEGTSHDR